MKDKRDKPMNRAMIAHHLELALNGDPDTFRQKIELLYKAIRPKRILHKTEYHHLDKDTITITLDRRRAKRVEEIFFEYLDTRNIAGTWSIKTTKPERLTPSKFRFTFKRQKEEIKIINETKSRKKEQPKHIRRPKRVSAEEVVDNMSDQEAAELLARLLAKHQG